MQYRLSAEAPRALRSSAGLEQRCAAGRAIGRKAGRAAALIQHVAAFAAFENIVDDLRRVVVNNSLRIRIGSRGKADETLVTARNLGQIIFVQLVHFIKLEKRNVSLYNTY